MSPDQAKELGLENNAFHLATAIDADSHCEPASRVVRDGHHKGTIFSRCEGKWYATDLEGKKFLGSCERLAVVTLDGTGYEDSADHGLNQIALGVDLECPGGEWIVDADDLVSLSDTYGDELVVKWEQDE